MNKSIKLDYFYLAQTENGYIGRKKHITLHQL